MRTKARFYIPIWASWVWRWLPQPRFLRRWYYRKSFDWWGHPSNHHWKGWGFPPCSDGGMLPWGFWSELRPGERDLWLGYYCSSGMQENQR